MKFHSKRNEVWLRDGAVHKHGPNAQQEAETLQLLFERGVRVPKVLDCDENLLVLEFLPGEPLPDLIERGNYCPVKLAQALFDWLTDFHRACPGKSHGDINGRNFLYDGNVVYGVDFEDTLLPGSIARDFERLAMFLAKYDTEHTTKQAQLIHEFTQIMKKHRKTI